MNDLQLNEVGTFGELSKRPNPHGYALRSQDDPLDFLVNAVVEMDGDILDASALAARVDQMPVSACLPNVDDPQLPFLVNVVEHSEYLRRIKEAQN